MTEKTLRGILHHLFQVPLDISLDEDLVAYIQDSIDVGELVAELKEKHGIVVKITEFKHVRTLLDVLVLLNKTHTS